MVSPVIMTAVLLKGERLLPKNIYQLKLCCRFYPSNKVSVVDAVTPQKKNRTYHEKEKTEKKEKLDLTSISLLTIPILSFFLGIWQIRRKAWKEALIGDLKNKMDQKPVPLMENLDNLENMNYCPVMVKGKFHHDRELYIGPRQLILKERTRSTLGSHSKIGYLVITPFEISGSGKTILVNRGWIPLDEFKRRTISEDTNEEVELSGLVRLNEKRAPLGVQNRPEHRIFVYRDIPQMAETAKTEPIFVDADASSTVPGGPIGGQTNITIRNEHLSYIVTWFGLSAATAGLWYLKYMR